MNYILISLIGDDYHTNMTINMSDLLWKLTSVMCVLAPDACDSYPCSNGGTCITDDDKSYLCSCSTGFSGRICEIGNYSYYICRPNITTIVLQCLI